MTLVVLKILDLKMVPKSHQCPTSAKLYESLSYLQTAMIRTCGCGHTWLECSQ